MLGRKWLMYREEQKRRVDRENEWSWRRWNALSLKPRQLALGRTGNPQESLLDHGGGYLLPGCCRAGGGRGRGDGRSGPIRPLRTWGLQFVRLEAGDARSVARAIVILRLELQQTTARRTMPLTLPAAVGPFPDPRAGSCHWA